MIIFPEVFVDVMGAVWYPVSESDHAFTILGRQMGWFIVAGWFGFGSLFMYTSFKVFQLRLSTRAIWLAFFGACLGATVFEEILQNMGGMYVYYANQPLIVLWKLPWWWTPCNATGVFLAAAIAYRLREQLRGWRGLAMFAITPAAMGAAYGFIALPSWIVVNGDYSWWVTQLGGLASTRARAGGRRPHHQARPRPGSLRPVGSTAGHGDERGAATGGGDGRLNTHPRGATPAVTRPSGPLRSGPRGCCRRRRPGRGSERGSSSPAPPWPA